LPPREESSRSAPNSPLKIEFSLLNANLMVISIPMTRFSL
jgi:hypothetical protein